ncbi:MAG: hypothetical protein WBV79_10185, partial [Rhodomicrobium sp.]
MPPIPPDAMASASPMVAQDAPIAPAAMILCAISTHLCAFAWGRNLTPSAVEQSRIRAILRSRISMSTRSAGVGTSDRRIKDQPPELLDDTLLPGDTGGGRSFRPRSAPVS